MKKLFTMLLSLSFLFVLVGCEKPMDNNVPTASDKGIVSSEDSLNLKDKSKDNTEQNNFISKDKAKSLALAHASLKAEDIFDYEIELDRDDATPNYEISFKSGGYEYDYEIDAISGKIIKSEKERDY